MKAKRLYIAALLTASASFSCLAFAATPPIIVLNAAVATTSAGVGACASSGAVTAGCAVSTGQYTAVDAFVWSAAGGSYTVLLEERASDAAPWVTVATMANCDANGSGTVTPASTGTPATGTCGFSTLAPKSLTRLRISARVSGTISGVIHAR
jgi:hypothetical protein